jgi:class 3 adenylate cyclase
LFRRKSRFGDLVGRQLDLFERENAGLLEDVREAERAYDRAERGEGEERYGEYVDLVDTAVEALEEIRDTFARTVDGDAVEEYEAEFAIAARKRFPKLPLV